MARFSRWDVRTFYFASPCRFVYKKLISRWDSRTLPPESRHRCKNCTSPILRFLVTIAYLIGESRLFRASWLFYYLRL